MGRFDINQAQQAAASAQQNFCYVSSLVWLIPAVTALDCAAGRPVQYCHSLRSCCWRTDKHISFASFLPNESVWSQGGGKIDNQRRPASKYVRAFSWVGPQLEAGALNQLQVETTNKAQNWHKSKTDHLSRSKILFYSFVLFQVPSYEYMVCLLLLIKFQNGFTNIFSLYQDFSILSKSSQECWHGKIFSQDENKSKVGLLALPVSTTILRDENKSSNENKESYYVNVVKQCLLLRKTVQ